MYTYFYIKIYILYSEINHKSRINNTILLNIILYINIMNNLIEIISVLNFSFKKKYINIYTYK